MSIKELFTGLFVMMMQFRIWTYHSSRPNRRSKCPGFDLARLVFFLSWVCIPEAIFYSELSSRDKEHCSKRTRISTHKIAY